MGLKLVISDTIHSLKADYKPSLYYKDILHAHTHKKNKKEGKTFTWKLWIYALQNLEIFQNKIEVDDINVLLYCFLYYFHVLSH